MRASEITAGLLLTVFVLLLGVAPTCFAAYWFSDAWRVAGAIRQLRSDREGHGRAVVVAGRARRPESGTREISSTAAWLGHAGRWEKSGKSSVFRTYCTLAEIDGMRIEDATGTTYVVRDLERRTDGNVKGLRLRPGAVLVDFVEYGPRDHQALTDRAKTACTSLVGLTGVEYVERTIPDGELVVMRGCRSASEANVIVPCADGLDVLSARSLDDVATDTKDAASGQLMVATLLGILGLGLAGLIGGASVVRARPKAKAGASS